MNTAAKTQTSAPTDEAMSIHLLRALTHFARQECRVHLEDVAAEAGVRKIDARRLVRELDRQGFVDAMRMRPTLAGFALGASVADVDLKPLRESRNDQHITHRESARAA